MNRVAHLLQSSSKMLIMGIVNATPDSFADEDHDGLTPDTALRKVERLLREGADLIDIGGESYHPQAVPIDLAEEAHRVLPVVRAIKHEFGVKTLISVDTRRAEIARAALDLGCDVLNLHGGLQRVPVARDVASSDATVVSYHIDSVRDREIPGLFKALQTFFETEYELGQDAGMSNAQFIFDPGVGIGKTLAQSRALIQHFCTLNTFLPQAFPLLLGAARKEHLGRILAQELHLEHIPGPLERLEAGLAEAAIAVQQEARIIRTHDVKATASFFAVWHHLTRS